MSDLTQTSVRRLTWLLFALFWLLPAPFLPEYGGANPMTRLMLTTSVVDAGTTRIDPYHELTVDKALHGGHFYSDKAPGMAILAVPVYAGARAFADADGALLDLVEPGKRFETLNGFSAATFKFILFFGAGLLFACAGVALFRLCLHLSGNPTAAVMATSTAMLATPYLGWSTQFLGHATAGSLLIIAFALSHGLTLALTTRSQIVRAAIAGACLSFAVSVEYTAAPSAAIVGFYALWRLSGVARPQAFWFFGAAMAGGILAAAPMLIYHHISFGSPFAVGYSSVVGFEGMEEGFHGLTLPDLEVIAKLLVGPQRGLIWLSPVLVFGLYGLWWAFRKRALSPEIWVALAVIGYYFALNGSYYYWQGGSSIGPRHTIPAMPFFGIVMLGAWLAITGPMRRLLVAFFCLSVFLNVAAASVDMTVTLGYGFPVYDPILTGVFTENNSFARLGHFGIPLWASLGLWLIVMGALIWTLARCLHVLPRAEAGDPVPTP
ncbi:MAG: hypothetical protein AAGF74_18950 [Pseudomonadota bacterium]